MRLEKFWSSCFGEGLPTCDGRSFSVLQCASSFCCSPRIVPTALSTAQWKPWQSLSDVRIGVSGVFSDRIFPLGTRLDFFYRRQLVTGVLQRCDRVFSSRGVFSAT